MKRFIVSEQDTLKTFTDNHCAQASFCFRTLLKNREIRVNGEKTGRDVALSPGDEVCYFLTPAQEQKPAFQLLYEDENLLALDKESGVNSEAVFCALNALPVHRLDRNTQGLLLLAKNEAAQQELISCFRTRRVRKEYLALVFGKMPKQADVVSAYLRKDPASARVQVSSSGAGEKIVTEYRVLKERGETSLVKIILHTGKTHQIRAHLAFLGCPVVGDEKYGDARLNQKFHRTRQMLLAKSITLFPQGILSYLYGKTFTSKKTL